MSEQKIYKDGALKLAAFLGGPLAAGFLFSENFKTLGNPNKVRITWIVTIVSTVVIFGGLFLIPDDVKIPNMVIPLIYTGIAMLLFKKYQEEDVLNHIASGGSVHSWRRVVGLSLLGLLITIVPIFSYAFLSDTLEEANYSTKSYGINVKHEISFDRSNISENEIDQIADGFIDAGFFDLSVAKYVFVVKNGSTYEISISVVAGTENDSKALQPFIELRDQMDAYLPYKKIEFKLVVDYIDNVVKVLK